MRTFKRRIVDIDTSVNNISKYNNQLTFTGIKQSKNIYEVDQKSQMDTLNVYVNDENTLVSREPLIEDTLDIELDGELIDIKETNGVKVYVTKTETNYKIIAKRNDETAELTATEYHLAIFNQYIICFRTEGAQVIDTSINEIYWQDFRNVAEIPVTKITTGSDVEKFDNNKFNTKYKEQFIIKEDLRTILPKNETPINVELFKENIKYTINDFEEPDKLTQYRLYNICDKTIIRPQSISVDSTSIHNNVVCISRNDYFEVSYDYGNSFIKVLYPETLKKMLQAELSEDGRAVFIVCQNAVYRCLLSDYSWTKYYIGNDETLTIKQGTYSGYVSRYKFINADNFMFFYEDYVDRRLYFKSPYLSNNYANDVLDYISLGNEIPFRSVNMGVDFNFSFLYEKQAFDVAISENNIAGAFTLIRFIADSEGSDYTSIINYIVVFKGTTDSNIETYVKTEELAVSPTNEMCVTITDIRLTIADNKWTILIYGANSHILSTSNNEYTITITYQDRNWVYSYSKGSLLDDSEFGNLYIKIDSSVYWNASGGQKLLNTSTDKYYNMPTYTNEAGTTYTIRYIIPAYNSDYIYYISDNQTAHQGATEYNLLSTNLSTSTIIFTYEYEIENNDNILKKIPTLSYSGAELFLAFDNTLMITKNTKDGSNILFNLPKINNQDFVDNITNMINISTSELAIFFKNNILICTRQSDETFGYVYTYSKTRLSLGVRLGDDVINTLDGANSIFPTIRGLAIMNYQAYMATTDQMLTFATDDINQLWNEFYSKSSNIKIIQMRNYIYLSNGTNEYLMFDVRTASWWKFKIPFAITKMLTDQLHLNIVSSKLYKLDTAFDKNKYIDCDDNHIDWYIVSQRLHFGVPNHYKNLKQLIFQLVQSNNFENTINTEIKLYRKTITYKEPEMIRFKIDEYKTVVKRFNYWKINELQWALSSDNNTNIPAQLILNGIDIKYEIGEEVR